MIIYLKLSKWLTNNQHDNGLNCFKVMSSNLTILRLKATWKDETQKPDVDTRVSQILLANLAFFFIRIELGKIDNMLKPAIF